MKKDIEIDLIKENLKDAGFKEEEIDDFLSLYQNKDKIEECVCLESKRKELLDKIHKKEKQINCLDYLYYKILKEEV